MIVIGIEADVLGVERLGAIDVGDRHWDQFQLHVQHVVPLQSGKRRDTANYYVIRGLARVIAEQLAVFVAARQIEWLPGLLLGAGLGVGGAVGARLAVRGGDRLIRPVVGAAVVALAARMLGWI